MAVPEPVPILVKTRTNSFEESRQKVAFDLSNTGQEGFSPRSSTKSSYRRRSGTLITTHSEKPVKTGRNRSASDIVSTARLEKQEDMRLKRLSSGSKRSSQGSMKELPPLPADHVKQIKRASNASTASNASRSYLPRLELGDVSLGVPDDMLSPTESGPGSSIREDGYFRQSRNERQASPIDAVRPARRRACSTDSHVTSPLEVVRESPKSESRRTSRSMREETRRMTALWISMLDDRSPLHASTRSLPALLSPPYTETAPVSPAVSSDCLDPFLKAYLPPSSYSSAHYLSVSQPASSSSIGNRHKPLPPSPRLLSPAAVPFSNPFEASFSSSSTSKTPSQSSPRRASLPANIPSSSSSRTKSRPPPLNFLAPITDIDESVHTALPYTSQRSQSLPTNEADLPSLSSSQTITQAYQSRIQQRRYRFPSASPSSNAELSPRDAMASFNAAASSLASSYEMSRSRETSFSSASAGSTSFFFSSSDEERSRRSSNFTADSSIPSPRSFSQDEDIPEEKETRENENRTPKMDDEYVDDEDLTEVPIDRKSEKSGKQHARISSTESKRSRKGRDREGSMKESPTMNIVMYGVAM